MIFYVLIDVLKCSIMCYLLLRELTICVRYVPCNCISCVISATMIMIPCSLARKSWPRILQRSFSSPFASAAILIDSSAVGVTHFTNLCFFRLTCIHSLLQNKHLSAGNSALYVTEDAAEEGLLLFKVPWTALTVAVELILRFPAFGRSVKSW